MLHARTPKDRTFVLVTPDILKMEATAQVINAFPLESFPLERKPLSSLQELFYLHTLYKKRYECRPEDNGDNDTIVFNKHSEVKKSQLAKET